MKLSSLSVFATAIFMLFYAQSGGAADLYEPRYSDPWSKAQSRLMNFGHYETDYARWYVRVDGSAAIDSNLSIVEDQIYPLSDEDFENSWSIGGGVGAYFANNFRGDLTLDWRFESKIDGIQTAWPGIIESREFQIESLLALANIYYDFRGNWNNGLKDGPNSSRRITPYVGAGIGVAHHRTRDGLAETSTGTFVNMGDTDETNFAFALMAGVGWKINEAMHLDVGYRYLDMGDITSGKWNNGTGFGELEIEDLYAHEIRFGLRHSFR